MEYAYKLVLLAGYLLFPGVVLVKGNAFRSARETLLRATAATALAWLWLVGVALVVTPVDVWLAGSAAEVEAIVAGDGAKYAAALLFGWLPSLVVVALSWAVIRLGRAGGHLWRQRSA